MIEEPAEEPTPEPKPRKPRGRIPGLAALAVVVAIVALAVAAWSVWRLQRFAHAEEAARKQDAATIADLQSQLAAGNQQAQAGNHRIGTLETGVDDLRTTVQGLGRRVANLETAFTNLNGQQQSGRDTLLLNDAEMLLRTGQQRYELFHDSVSALKAYSQAIEVLAQVQNPAYAPVRASATTERDALAAAAPPSRQAALDTLSRLRSKSPTLALASHGPASASSAARPGFWSRVGRAFSGIVRVSHDDGTAAPLADPRLAPQALALDLAQAQEALLAFDETDYRDALQRADALLSAQYDPQDADVKDARAQIAQLLAQRASGPAPQLGGALAQLQSLRASQTPAVPATPGSAASSGARP
jgi:uroporphyrin-3 C-methyltransferase